MPGLATLDCGINAVLKALLLPFRLLYWLLTLQLGQRFQFRRDYRLVAESGLFDAIFYLRQSVGSTKGIDPLRDYLLRRDFEKRDRDASWYLTQNQNAAGTNPLLHYLTHGWKEGRNPHPLFDGNWYLQQNPDVATSGTNPLVHYVRWGWREGRNPHPLFDSVFYLECNPDVAEAEAEPLSHYVLEGGYQARDPHPLFDSRWYARQCPELNSTDEIPLIHYLRCPSGRLKSPHPLFDAEFYLMRYPEAAVSGMPALMHYMVLGAKSGRNPHPLFDAGFYMRQQRLLLNPEFVNPLEHYVRIGALQGLDPSELFDSSFYLEQYPEVREAGLNPLAHFWMEGAMKGYKPNSLFDTALYLKNYPDVAIARVNPLVHFIDWGANEGRFPNPFFDPLFYLKNNPDVKLAGQNPLAHYLQKGAKADRDPGPFFNTSRYVSEYPDLSTSETNPLAHFLGYSSHASPRQASASCDDNRGNRTHATALPETGVCDYALPEPPNCRVLASCESIAAANALFRNASDANCHLLILFGPLAPDKAVIRRLIDCFSIDPHFGAAIPRQHRPSSEEILKLSDEQGDPEITSLSPQVLSEIPQFYILPEILSSCLLLRDTVISNLGCLDDAYETIAGALQEYLCRARRCGFRCVVANDAVLTAASENSSWMLKVEGDDLVRVHTDHLDIGKAKLQFVNHPLHIHESLLGRAFSPIRSVRQTLLVDARGIPAQMNGTTKAVLGVCDGLQKLNSQWAISLWATLGAAGYHNLHERYPDWEIIDETRGRFFTAAFRPSQPWYLNSIIELHRKALFNFYTVLDTIAWDIFFVAPDELTTTWDFLSSHADGILYISKYTQDRFVRRFPQAKSTPGYVSYLSLNPHDYKCQSAENDVVTQEEFFLIFGNSYEHKDVRPTVDLVASKFPGRRIKALGVNSHANPSVECLEGGQIFDAEIDLLFANAKLVIFPSFYEGFGFPVLQGLSNGRTVIARHSELLVEIAAHYRGPGRLIAFHNPKELFDVIERVIHGLKVDELTLGAALNSDDEPSDWQDIARGVLRFIEERVQRVDQSRWYARQKAIELINVI